MSTVIYSSVERPRLLHVFAQASHMLCRHRFTEAERAHRSRCTYKGFGGAIEGGGTTQPQINMNTLQCTPGERAKFRSQPSTAIMHAHTPRSQPFLTSAASSDARNVRRSTIDPRTRAFSRRRFERPSPSASERYSSRSAGSKGGIEQARHAEHCCAGRHR